MSKLVAEVERMITAYRDDLVTKQSSLPKAAGLSERDEIVETFDSTLKPIMRDLEKNLNGAMWCENELHMEIAEMSMENVSLKSALKLSEETLLLHLKGKTALPFIAESSAALSLLEANKNKEIKHLEKEIERLVKNHAFTEHSHRKALASMNNALDKKTLDIKHLEKDVDEYLDRLTLILSRCSPDMQRLYQSMGWFDLEDGKAKRVEDE